MQFGFETDQVWCNRQARDLIQSVEIRTDMPLANHFPLVVRIKVPRFVPET